MIKRFFAILILLAGLPSASVYAAITANWNTASTATTCTIPASDSAANGDILLCLGLQNSNSPVPCPSSGGGVTWSPIVNAGGGSGLNASGQIQDGATNNWITGCIGSVSSTQSTGTTYNFASGGSVAGAFLQDLSGASSTLDYAEGLTQATSSTFTLSAITLSAADYVSYGTFQDAENVNTNTYPSGFSHTTWTSAYDGSGWKVFTSSGSTGSLNVTNSTTTVWTAIVFALEPSGGVATGPVGFQSAP